MPVTDILNPMTPIVNNAEISDSNPLICSSAAVSSTPVATVIFANPVTWIYNGAPVSDTNPLPISIV